jgi:hypothetical protein
MDFAMGFIDILSNYPSWFHEHTEFSENTEQYFSVIMLFPGTYEYLL